MILLNTFNKKETSKGNGKDPKGKKKSNRGFVRLKKEEYLNQFNLQIYS